MVLLGCGRTAGEDAPPGVAVGARIAYIRMFEFHRQSRTTLVNGTVLAVRWPWVELGASDDPESRTR